MWSLSIMAHPRRAQMVEELQQEFPDVPVAWDTDNNVWHTCREAWRLHDPTAKWHIVLQDDVIVAKDFVEKATSILNSLERECAVCFFVGDKAQRHGGQSFYARKIYNEVAICLPTHRIQPMIALCDAIGSSTDRDIERYCKRSRLPVYYPIPSIVEHRDSPSLYREIYKKHPPTTPRTAYKFNDATPTGTIGIGVTTRNRKDLCMDTVERIRQMTPNATVVVVDDASIDPPPSDFRYEYNVGIARAKNKCLELLEGHDHVFLFDDDVYPTSTDWYEPYVRSPYPHLMYIFSYRRRSNRKLWHDKGHRAFEAPRGCMLYFKREALDTVGGFDLRHGLYGYEHVELSRRIHTTLGTPYPFMDIDTPQFYSYDEHKEVESTVDKFGKEMQERHKVTANLTPETLYLPYTTTSTQHTTILSTYFTKQQDPQRNEHWTWESQNALTLHHSVKATGNTLVLFSDTEIPIPYTHATGTKYPAVDRWYVYRKWLKKNRPEWVFMVDSTDVEAITAPTCEKGVLYMGDEPHYFGYYWIQNWFKSQIAKCPQEVKDFYHQATKDNVQILNAGTVGGDYDTVMEFLDHMCATLDATKDTDGVRDMPAVNYVARTFFADRLVHGLPVNSVFKEEMARSGCWFRHK